MEIRRGMLGPLPYAETGTGLPLAVFAGLAPVTGVDGDGLVGPMIAPFRGLARHRRVLLFNRRPNLPVGLSMAELAAEHAEALRTFGEPVDVVGLSTGGSIAQQLAADHPGVVRKLALVSTACRLGGTGRSGQAEVARLIRAGEVKQAAGVAAAEMVPRWFAPPLVRALASAASSRLIPTDQDAADLATTIEAEDGFDLARCPAITAATLIVAGGRDRYYPQPLFHQTAALIAGSHLEIFGRRGHITVLRDRTATGMLAGFLGWS